MKLLQSPFKFAVKIRPAAPVAELKIMSNYVSIIKPPPKRPGAPKLPSWPRGMAAASADGVYDEPPCAGLYFCREFKTSFGALSKHPDVKNKNKYCQNYEPLRHQEFMLFKDLFH